MPWKVYAKLEACECLSRCLGRTIDNEFVFFSDDEFFSSNEAPCDKCDNVDILAFAESLYERSIEKSVSSLACPAFTSVSFYGSVSFYLVAIAAFILVLIETY